MIVEDIESRTNHERQKQNHLTKSIKCEISSLKSTLACTLTEFKQ